MKVVKSKKRAQGAEKVFLGQVVSRSTEKKREEELKITKESIKFWKLKNKQAEGMTER